MGSKPKKRVITAARKEQNRLAQRAFRQRRKKRREVQECGTEINKRSGPVLLLPRVHDDENARNEGNSAGILGESPSTEDCAMVALRTKSDLGPKGDQIIATASNPIELEGEATQDDGQQGLEDEQTRSTKPRTLSPQVSELGLARQNLWASSEHGFNDRGGVVLVDGSGEVNFVQPGHLGSDDGEISMDGPRDQAMDQRISNETIAGSELVNAAQCADLDVGHHNVPERDPSIDLDIFDYTGLSQADFCQVNRSADALPFGTPEHTLASSMFDHQALPSPYLNNIHLTSMTLLTAVFNNARHLRLNIPQITNPAYISPFYRPSVLPSDSPSTLLAPNTHPDIPPHLRPTLPQILFPHHACLDLIPLRSLRSKAVMMAATMPHTFDVLDLKRDVYFEDALRCARRNARGECLPWDPECWEAKGWFVRKWRFLMDGDEDGELEGMSAWWSMRM